MPPRKKGNKTTTPKRNNNLGKVRKNAKKATPKGKASEPSVLMSPVTPTTTSKGSRKVLKKLDLSTPPPSPQKETLSGLF